MPEPHAESCSVLVADIGGTNARFACLDLTDQRWLGEWAEPVSKHPDIASAIRQALAEIPVAVQVEAVCIAVAGPVNDDWVQISNNDWAFSRRQLKQQFAWSQLAVINDFHAAAFGALSLSARQLLPLGTPASGERQPKSLPEARHLPCAVLGPGTGLGVAALYPDADGDGVSWTAIPTEGGHARFAPVDDEECAILRVLRGKLGTVQREDLLSGRGLSNLSWALAQLWSCPGAPPMQPAAITAQALAEPDSHSARVLERFCAILGSVAADVALDLGTRGRLFLAGGILPRIADFLAASDFRRRFDSHSQFHQYLSSIETVLVMEPRLGLMGAANYLRKHLPGWRSALKRAP